MAKKDRSVIQSEVSQGESCLIWNWEEEKDYISEFYEDDHSKEQNDDTNHNPISPIESHQKLNTRKKSERRVQFRFNSEKGGFEEIILS